MSSKIELSVIVPVTESRYDDIQEIYFEYKKAIESTGLKYELVYVLDGAHPTLGDKLESLIKEGEALTIVKLARGFGEATALRVGFEHSTGDLIMTLPAYQQVKHKELQQLVTTLCEEDLDMVVSRRWPRLDSRVNRIQSKVFNKFIMRMTGTVFNDLGCSVRVFKRKVIDEIQLYGDQHRFLPVLAHRYGFKVQEKKVQQSQKDMFQRVYPLGIYIRRLLDLLSVFFVIKFTKKPLRFFGLIGCTMFAIGALSVFYLVSERLFAGIELADRPALMISSLFVVLGVQIVSIGLIGEMIIFTHAKDIKEYTIEEVIN